MQSYINIAPTFYLLQNSLVKRTSTVNISKRPISIRAAQKILAEPLIHAKVVAGPTPAKAGPTLLIEVSDALIAVAQSELPNIGYNSSAPNMIRSI